VQSTAFALAKIQPPSLRTQVIARGALEARLQDATLRSRLTLVCAPAGFGKTIALSRLVQSLNSLPVPARAAWVSLDEDDDVQRFVGLLCAALEPFDLPWRLSPDALAGLPCESRTERRKVAGELVNALAASDLSQGVIVLDDLHRLQDPAVFEMLAMLLDLLPEQWSVRRGHPGRGRRCRWRPATRGETSSPSSAGGGTICCASDAAEVTALAARTASRSSCPAVDLLGAQRKAGRPRPCAQPEHRSGAHHVAAARAQASHDGTFRLPSPPVLDDMPSTARLPLSACSVLARAQRRTLRPR
jgi:hypothetical protein